MHITESLKITIYCSSFGNKISKFYKNFTLYVNFIKYMSTFCLYFQYFNKIKKRKLRKNLIPASYRYPIHSKFPQHL